MKTSWEVSKKPFNKKKNRYGNIVTCKKFEFALSVYLLYIDHDIIMYFFTDDYSRVVLSGDETEDYINASFVDVSFSN
jgi:protein tyrosine phosphatase